MNKFALLSLSALLFVTTFASASSRVNWPPQTVFYGGDFDPNNPNANALANENDGIVVPVTAAVPYGAATYQNFIYESDECWPNGCYVTGLFTNNMSALNPKTAYWEIRTGVSEGNGGTLIASGTYGDSHTPTGRSGFGFSEYQDMVSGLYVTLSPGTPYWFAVVPNDPTNRNRSFNSNTFGLNAVGTQISDEQYFNSAFFGAHFTNADNRGVFPTFSSGVLDQLVLDRPVPEPSSIILLGSGLVAAAGVVRRGLTRQLLGAQ